MMNDNGQYRWKKLVWSDKLDLEAFYRSCLACMRRLDQAEETMDPAASEDWTALSKE